MNRATRLTACVVVAVGLVGCARAEPDDSLATLAIIDEAADWRQAEVGDFVRASDGQPLEVGNDVRTDETGFAEIEYVDGSLTRLDVSTEFRVVALAGDAASPEIDVSLESGRMWNRVRSVTGATGDFEVETEVGVAAVRGTAFAISCEPAGPCDFDVTEGRVEVTVADGRVIAVEEGRSATIDTDGRQTRWASVSRDLTAPTGWAGRNSPRDERTGRFTGLNGNCSASIGTYNLVHATSPETAAIIDVREPVVNVAAAATGPVDTYSVDLLFGPFRINAAADELSPPDQTYSGRLIATDYAFAGTGLYKVEATTTGTPCAMGAYVRLIGRSPLTTLLGVIGFTLLALGLAGLGWAPIRRARALGRARREGGTGIPGGHRVQGGLSGVAAGLGAAITAQQYGYTPLTLQLLAAAAVAGALVGVLAGWPWHVASASTPVSDPEA